MLIGLLTGAAAAIIASLISLPLESPDDAFFNTATITVGALLAGLVAGGLRNAMSVRTFAIAWGGAFIVTLVALALGPFDRMLPFGAPLAAIVFAITGLGVVYARDMALPRLPVMAGGAAAVALAVGLGLSGANAETGSLSLPAAPASTSTSAAATSTTSAGTGAATASATGTAGASATTAPGGVPAQFTTPADLRNVTFVVGEGSKATFTVNEKLAQLPLPNDAVMRTSALGGNVRLDGRASTITVDLQKLTSDQSRRDQVVQRMFSQNPTATLTVPSITNLPARYEGGQVVKQSVQGTMSVNGVQKPMTFEVEARLDGTVLSILGKTSFVWSDFNIAPPNTPSVQVQDRVAVEVLLAARPQAG